VVHPFGARDRRVDQLGGADGAGTDQLGQPEGVVGAKIVERHRRAFAPRVRSSVTTTTIAATAVSPRTTTSMPYAGVQITQVSSACTAANASASSASPRAPRRRAMA